jgi:hypothetical protein
MNGIKVYAPIAVSKLHEYQNLIDRGGRSIRLRLVKTEKVRRMNRCINGR